MEKDWNGSNAYRVPLPSYHIGLFLFKILSKNSILTLTKGLNSIANLPKIEHIQALMHVHVTCKNEDQIENEGARLFTIFLPL